MHLIDGPTTDYLSQSMASLTRSEGPPNTSFRCFYVCSFFIALNRIYFACSVVMSTIWFPIDLFRWTFLDWPPANAGRAVNMFSGVLQTNLLLSCPNICCFFSVLGRTSRPRMTFLWLDPRPPVPLRLRRRWSILLLYGSQVMADQLNWTKLNFDPANFQFTY